MKTTSYVMQLSVNTEKLLPVRIIMEFSGSRQNGWPRILRNVYLRRGLSVMKVSDVLTVVSSETQLHRMLVPIVQALVVCHKFITTKSLSRSAYIQNVRLLALCSLHQKVSKTLSLEDLLSSSVVINAMENLFMFHCGQISKIPYSQRFRDLTTLITLRELDCMELLTKVCRMNSIPFESGVKAVVIKKSPLVSYPDTLKFYSKV